MTVGVDGGPQRPGHYERIHSRYYSKPGMSEKNIKLLLQCNAKWDVYTLSLCIVSMTWWGCVVEWSSQLYICAKIHTSNFDNWFCLRVLLLSFAVDQSRYTPHSKTRSHFLHRTQMTRLSSIHRKLITKRYVISIWPIVLAINTIYYDFRCFARYYFIFLSFAFVHAAVWQ